MYSFGEPFFNEDTKERLVKSAEKQISTPFGKGYLSKSDDGHEVLFSLKLI